jgi:hypothetical protein
VLCGGSVLVRGKGVRIGCFLSVCGWVLCGGWGCVPLVLGLRVSGSRVTCSNIPMRCPQKVLKMKNKYTSVFHRAVRVRFVPHKQDFLKNLKNAFSVLFPFEKRGQSCGRRSGRPRENGLSLSVLGVYVRGSSCLGAWA